MDSDNNQNNREFTRVPIKIETTLEFEGTTINSINTQDLSMRGLFVQTDESLPEGSLCKVSLSLSGQPDPLKLIMNGVVQRMTDGGVGIEFTEIDLESYFHLKNIVMLNTTTSNIDSVEGEIGEHIGLNKRK